MGSLGCPLCCHQDFGSVGALWDHLIYYIYRPLQCAVCCLHLEGIQEFMHHIKCHMGEGLPATAKVTHPKPPPLPPTGDESHALSPPPPADATPQDILAVDPDVGIGGAQLSDGFSSYMKAGDAAANQLLKLREWQLEKLGKNFRRQKASFGKSPGVIELSPASGRVHRGSPPVSARDLVQDCRPSSQGSCYTPRSDLPSIGKSIDSVERFDSSATPHSVYGNMSFVPVSEHSTPPQSVNKQVSEELDLCPPAQPASVSYRTPSLPSKPAVSSPLKPVALVASLNSQRLNTVIREAEHLPENVNELDTCALPESTLSCDAGLNQQPTSVSASAPSLYALSAQEVASCSLPPSRNEMQGLQEYRVCETDFPKSPMKNPVAETSAPSSIESYDNTDRWPLLRTIDPEELSVEVSSPVDQYHELGADMCSPTNLYHEVNVDVSSPARQYHELQPVTHNKGELQTFTGTDREQPQPFSTNKQRSVIVNEEQRQPLTMNRGDLSFNVSEQPQPAPMNKDLVHSLTPNRGQHQPVTLDGEEIQSEGVSGVPESWLSCPSSHGTTGTSLHKPAEASDNQKHQTTIDSYMLPDSHFSDIEDISNRHSAYSYWPSNYNEEESFHTEEMSYVTRNVSLDPSNLPEADALKGMRNKTHPHDGGNRSTWHCSHYEGEAPREGGCEELLCTTAVDTKPYLHKKFHHDQERKMLSSTGVEQADVSQYINSFQSVLVRKLNATLGTTIPMTSSVCSMSEKKPEKETNREGLEQPQLQPHPHQPQAKEYTCEVCQQKYKNLSTFELHCKEHEKGEGSCTKNLYVECPKKSSEGGKWRKKANFQCDQCHKVFPKAFNFARHMREVHAVKKSFVCLHCNKAFSSKRHLQEHSGIHKGQKAHECTHCHHLCYTASGLRTHIQEFHSSAEQRVYSCDTCGEKFTKLYGLKRHIQRKHKEQQLTCHICSKTFSCNEDMNKHSKTHIGVSILKCDSCNKVFSTPWALQRHSKTHNSSKSYTCDVCSKSFTRKDSLVSHIRTHSQRKPFVCHCGKRFIRKSQLKEHQDKHSSVPKYTCSICKHSFKFRVSLKNHSCKKENLNEIN